jgi:hypothetical protein
MQQGALSPSLQKQNEILALLTKCSLRRGAATNPETLAIYAQDLSSYDIDDVAAVLDDMGKEAPQDYKQLWPAIGTMLEAIRGRIRARRPTVEQEAADRWLRYIAAAKAEGTSEPDGEMLRRIESLNGKHNLTKPRVIDTTPVMQACPHCSQELPVSPNIRFWTVDELRSYADALENNQNARLACEQVS